MKCPGPVLGGMCWTCRLAGLVRCPTLGTPLPLVENERRVKYVYPPLEYDRSFDELMKHFGKKP